MKWIIYNLLFALAFPLMLPGFLIRMLRRGGYRARMGDRFALYPPAVIAALQSGEFVWVHAVSVGEVQVAGQLMRDWRKVDPTVRFCFSTTSSTGWKMAEKEVTPVDVLIYNPLDFPNFVKSALRTVRPRAIILTESEIWPVFIRTAKKAGVPLFLINARVSDRSAPRYAKAKFFFGDVFRSFTRIFAQSELDKSRLVAAGAPIERIEVTGSFKFDVAHRNPAKEEELRAWLGRPTEKVLLGGSTWPGEDEALLRIYGKLSGAKLVIAPRHFEKADAVEANIRAAGFECIRRSRGESAERPGANDPKRAVFLADTTGELMGLYGIADVVFVGKSLCEHGSQNMIEPCLCGKPTVVGPYTENFRPVMSDLLEGEGIVQVADEAALARTILGWFAKGDGGLGERAHRAVARRTGVVPKCTAAIRGAIAAVKIPARLGLAVLLSVCSGVVLAGATPRQMIPEVRLAEAYVTMVERPTALNVLLADDAAQGYSRDFASIGVKWQTPAEAKADRHFDIVMVGAPPKDLDWSPLVARLHPKGVLACALDVRQMTAGTFKSILESFPAKAGSEPHLWMIGEHDWLLTGRLTSAKVKMTALFELFAQNDGAAFAAPQAVAAGCNTIQGLFANYVGTRSELLPAFEGADLSVKVLPEHFMSRKIPDTAWIVLDGLDADIAQELEESFCRLQIVRRKVVEGMFLARQGKSDESVEAWRLARDEGRLLLTADPMLTDRLRQLAVNAKVLLGLGKIAEAAQCYAYLLIVCPDDLSVAESYYTTLKLLKRDDEAKEVIEKIRGLRERLEAQRPQGFDVQLQEAKRRHEEELKRKNSRQVQPVASPSRGEQTKGMTP